METGSDAKTFVSTELCFALQCGIRDKEMHLNIKSDTTCQDVDNHSVLQLFVTLYYKSRHFFEARNDRNVFDRQKKKEHQLRLSPEATEVCPLFTFCDFVLKLLELQQYCKISVSVKTWEKDKFSTKTAKNITDYYFIFFNKNKGGKKTFSFLFYHSGLCNVSLLFGNLHFLFPPLNSPAQILYVVTVFMCNQNRS